MEEDLKYKTNRDFKVKYNPPRLSVKQIARKLLHKKGVLVLGRNRKIVKNIEKQLHEMKDRGDLFVKHMTMKKFLKFQKKHPMCIYGSKGFSS